MDRVAGLGGGGWVDIKSDFNSGCRGISFGLDSVEIQDHGGQLY